VPETAIVDDALFRLAAAHGFPSVQLGPGVWVAAGWAAWSLVETESTAGERRAALVALDHAYRHAA
jgi:hypothetical protein